MNVLDINYYQTLENVYKKYLNVIVAFDFDNTVFDYHKKGIDFSPVINLLQKCNKLNFKLICFTSNYGDRLKFIEYYIKEVLNLKGVIINKAEGRSSISPGEKPYANIYLDDKAGLKESYKRLNKLITKIENKEL